MIRGNHGQRTRASSRRRFAAVRELRALRLELPTRFAKCLENCSEADRPQTDRDAQIAQRFELFHQIRETVAQLLRRRLVFRRRAAQRRGDEAIDEFEPVVSVDRVRFRRKTSAMQRGIEKTAGRVTGERTPGAVAAVRPGRQPDDCDAGAGAAERRDGLAPVDAIRVSPFFLERNAGGVRAQLRTARAGNDRALQRRERLLHENRLLLRRSNFLSRITEAWYSIHRSDRSNGRGCGTRTRSARHRAAFARARRQRRQSKRAAGNHSVARRAPRALPDVGRHARARDESLVVGHSAALRASLRSSFAGMGYSLRAAGRHGRYVGRRDSLHRCR